MLISSVRLKLLHSVRQSALACSIHQPLFLMELGPRILVLVGSRYPSSILLTVVPCSKYHAKTCQVGCTEPAGVVSRSTRQNSPFGRFGPILVKCCVRATNLRDTCDTSIAGSGPTQYWSCESYRLVTMCRSCRSRDQFDCTCMSASRCACIGETARNPSVRLDAAALCNPGTSSVAHGLQLRWSFV